MKWLLLFCCLTLVLFKPHRHFDHTDFYRDIAEKEQDMRSILPLLQQRYTYIGKGAQMVVFASEDGAYVLKLFKGHHKKSFKPSSLISQLTRSKADWEAAENRWKLKFADSCKCYEMAFKDLKEETGLVLLHFHKTSNPLPVTLFDNSAYRVDLAGLPFILQKKAVLAPEYFKQNPTKRVEAVQALKDFFVTRIQKGYSDPRQALNINYGYIDAAPVQIDVGKIEPFMGDIEAELKKIHAHVDAWASQL